MKKGLTISNTFSKKLRKLLALSPCSLYRFCSELPLDRFISCLVDKDLSSLIISGKPQEAELKQTWINIQEEYGELVKSDNIEFTNQLHSEVIVLQNRLFRISLCVEALQYVYSKDLIDELKEQHMPFDYNPDLPDKYYEDLRMTVERTRGLNLKLKLKQDELQEWYSRQETGHKETTREDFDNILATLTEANGFMVDESKITVKQYVRMYNRYQQKLIAQQREIDKRNS